MIMINKIIDYNSIDVYLYCKIVFLNNIALLLKRNQFSDISENEKPKK